MWTSHHKKDYNKLERIQRRATEIIPELGDLKEGGLTTLETRRLRGEQSKVYRILNGYENIDRNIFSHSKKIVKQEDMR